MDHDCLTFWGNHLTALAAGLDAGAKANPGAGWAARACRDDEYVALLLLKDRLLAARDLKIGGMKEREEHEHDETSSSRLLEAACNLVGGLEADRLSTSSGHHDAASKKHWHMTGRPDPDSVDEMTSVLWPRLANALGF